MFSRSSKILGAVVLASTLLMSGIANAFDFRVTGVWPSSYATKTVQVDVSTFPNSTYPWGWQSFFLNIDGYNYPISNWNAVPTSPTSYRAWFQVPAYWTGWRRVQLVVNYWAQPYYGYPVPVRTVFSYPQFYVF